MTQETEVLDPSLDLFAGIARLKRYELHAAAVYVEHLRATRHIVGITGIAA